jgi:hypothetical protein
MVVILTRGYATGKKGNDYYAAQKKNDLRVLDT